MIVTLTPNPSLDRTLDIDLLVRGEVVRARRSSVEAGGKGVNVTRVLVANGHRSRAVLPVGGSEGDHLQALVAAIGLEVVAVPVTGEVRTNISLVEPDGAVTKINAPGPTLRPDEVDTLEKATLAALDGADWLAGCGSLPPGAPEDLYGRLVASGHTAGVRVAVDTSGAPLAAAVAAAPDVIKPNVEELAAVAGEDLRTLGDVVAAAARLHAAGIGAVVVSLGADGAVLVDADGAVHAETPPVTPVSNVGAGDSLLAGFLSAGGAGPEALRAGVAWGTAAVQLPGTAMPAPDDIDLGSVRLGPVDATRALHE